MLGLWKSNFLIFYLRTCAMPCPQIAKIILCVGRKSQQIIKTHEKEVLSKRRMI